MINQELKKKIESCKTGKQVMKILEKNGLRISRNDTDEVGCFSVWLDEFTRIYKPVRGNMKVQKWEKVDMVYSGIPTFFDTGLFR